MQISFMREFDMLISGIAIDSAKTKIKEDGFSIVKSSNHYRIDFCVANAASKILNLKNYLKTGFKKSLLEASGVTSESVSFSNRKNSAFIFSIFVDFTGKVIRFSPTLGEFEIIESYVSDSSQGGTVVSDAFNCLNLVYKTKEYPFLTETRSLSTLIQNLTMLASLSLYDYMVNKVGVPMLCSGVVPYNAFGDAGDIYKMDVGKFQLLTRDMGVRVINGEGFISNIASVRSWSDEESKFVKGTTTVSISSPMAKHDAIINQVILHHHLIGSLVKDSSLLPSLQALSGLVKSGGSIKNKPPAFESLTGKLLKDFVAFLVSNKLHSAQIDLLLGCDVSETDKVYLSSYFIAMGVPLPDSLSGWLGQIVKSRSSSSANHFFHLIEGFSFATCLVADGFMSVSFSDNLYEVEDSSLSKFGILEKISKNDKRNVCKSLPITFDSQIEMASKLLSIPQVYSYFQQRGFLNVSY